MKKENKICKCGHEKKYHTGKDNWIRKSTSCHLCKCRKFKIAGCNHEWITKGFILSKSGHTREKGVFECKKCKKYKYEDLI